MERGIATQKLEWRGLGLGCLSLSILILVILGSSRTTPDDESEPGYGYDGDEEEDEGRLSWENVEDEHIRDVRKVLFLSAGEVNMGYLEHIVESVPGYQASLDLERGHWSDLVAFFDKAARSDAKKGLVGMVVDYRSILESKEEYEDKYEQASRINALYLSQYVEIMKQYKQAMEKLDEEKFSDMGQLSSSQDESNRRHERLEEIKRKYRGKRNEMQRRYSKKETKLIRETIKQHGKPEWPALIPKQLENYFRRGQFLFVCAYHENWVEQVLLEIQHKHRMSKLDYAESDPIDIDEFSNVRKTVMPRDGKLLATCEYLNRFAPVLFHDFSFGLENPSLVAQDWINLITGKLRFVSLKGLQNLPPSLIASWGWGEGEGEDEDDLEQGIDEQIVGNITNAIMSVPFLKQVPNNIQALKEEFESSSSFDLLDSSKDAGFSTCLGPLS